VRVPLEAAVPFRALGCFRVRELVLAAFDAGRRFAAVAAAWRVVRLAAGVARRAGVGFVDARRTARVLLAEAATRFGAALVAEARFGAAAARFVAVLPLVALLRAGEGVRAEGAARFAVLDPPARVLLVGPAPLRCFGAAPPRIGLAAPAVFCAPADFCRVVMPRADSSADAPDRFCLPVPAGFCRVFFSSAGLFVMVRLASPWIRWLAVRPGALC
jgi:hypothetical protein